MKRGWIIMCILVFGIVGCKDFLNLVPKNKRVVANLEDVKTELLTYLAAITYSTGGLSPSYGGSVFRFPLYNDVATQLCLYEDDMNMSYYSDHSSIEEKAMNVYTECIDWKGGSLAGVLWEKCYGAIGFLNVILDDLEKAGGYTQAEYETITGEVKTIRAYYIFKLLQFFAPYNSDKLGIPLNLDSENVIPGGRLSQREVYRIVIRELEDVLEYETVREKWNIFYYPGIVKAILAQVYMFKAGSAAAEESDWANAEKYSGELIAGYEPENREDILFNMFSGTVREYQVVLVIFFLVFGQREKPSEFLTSYLICMTRKIYVGRLGLRRRKKKAGRYITSINRDIRDQLMRLQFFSVRLRCI